MAKKLFGGLLISALLLNLSIAKDQKSEKVPAMPKPAFGPERARLSSFVGEFATDSKVHPNPVAPKGETAKGNYKGRWTLDSMFVVFEEAVEFPIFGKYRGMGILGYDPQEKKYHLSMYNNFGDHPAYKGNFVGDTLLLEGQVPFEGGAFTQQVVWLPEGKSLKLWVRNNIGQVWIPVIEQTYRPDGKTSNRNKKISRHQ